MFRWLTAFTIVATAHLMPIAAATVASPPPDVLKPYIHDGRYEPGDYGWMRGRFDDATPAQVNDAKEVATWLANCRKQGLDQTQSELRAMGESGALKEESPYLDVLCAQVASIPRIADRRSFAVFEQAVARARPLADTYLIAVHAAELSSNRVGLDLREALLIIPIAEQMLRRGLSWGGGFLTNTSPLPADVKAVFVARLSSAVAVRDHENTQWLKRVVESQGWPGITQVGERAADQAWLLAQHADADPIFQLKALRLMEPMVAKGEVSKIDFAYLWDRVMLKIEGRQRYGTQATCEKGARILRPLEDEAQLEARRKVMGLGPTTEYLDRMQKLFGDCPSA